MKEIIWEQWLKGPSKNDSIFIQRALGKASEMQSTKQLGEIISEYYKPNMTILDVGCNVGHFLYSILKMDTQVKYTGVDAYSHYIKKAKEIFSDVENVKFEVKNAFEPIYPDKPFDIVFCCNVLLHLPDFRIPVKNMLDSTKNFCLIRTLLGEKTTIVKSAITDEYDDQGNLLDYFYQNTWNEKYFVKFIEKLGWKVEIIEDRFDEGKIQNDFDNIKGKQGTKIIDNKQVVGNIIHNWKWVKITK